MSDENAALRAQVEELTRDRQLFTARQDAWSGLLEMRERAEQAEAKLARVVEALEVIVQREHLTSSTLVAIANAALAAARKSEEGR